MTLIERELKLRPDDPGLLGRLWTRDHLGAFQVIGRRQENQRNSFFDSRTRALGRARLALRRRRVAGEALATWTVKSEGELLRGVATRPEIELQLRDDTPPMLALGALMQAARQRGAAPLAQPYLELVTQRRILDLQDASDTQLELALDVVCLEDHPSHVEHEIEVELRRGDEAALEVARAAIAELGRVHDGQGSKLSRALDHVRTCPGC